MGTTADKLAKLAATKEAIRTAINDKGVEVSTSEPFASYPEKIAEISGTPKVSITITSNISSALFDVTYFNGAQWVTDYALPVGKHILPIVTSELVTIKAASTINGYAKPNSQTKNVYYEPEFDMNYVGSGVYIQHNDLSLYTQAEWQNKGFSASDSTSVVVVSTDHIVCLAKEFVSAVWCTATQASVLPGIMCTTDYNTAITDFNGIANTNQIVSQLGSSNLAGKSRAKYTSNAVRGYLGGFGEVTLVYNNAQAVVNAYSAIGISNAGSNYIVSSTQYNDLNVWINNTYNTKTTSRSSFVFFPFVSGSDCTTITIRTNVSSSEFNISFTNIVGETLSANRNAGKKVYAIDVSKPVTITPKDVEGLVTPAAITQYVTEGTIFDFKYNVPDVYIRTIDGDEYTPEEWRDNGYANSDADCVVVRSEKASFGIALQYSGYLAWSTDYVLISDIVTTTDSSSAILDLDGRGNTPKIIAQMGAGKAPAAEYCANYKSKGGLQGYLPSLGEIKIIVDNFTRVNDAFKACGGHSGSGLMVSDRLWSSTQYSDGYAWRYYFDTISTRNAKTSTEYVNPFLILPD